MASQHEWMDAFVDIMSDLPAGNTIDIDQLLTDSRVPQAKRKTKLAKLKQYAEQNLSAVDRIDHWLPPPDVIIDIAEMKMGKTIREADLNSANQIVTANVNQKMIPISGKMIDQHLSRFIVGNNLTIPRADLSDFLINEYSPFVVSQGNQLVSFSGRVNELLLVRAMHNHGMLNPDEFTHNTTKRSSRGDITVLAATHHEHIDIEVKSYRARERLERGLADISGDAKVGAGFFTEKEEFSMDHSRRLVRVGTAAVYMPTTLLNTLDPPVRNFSTHHRLLVGNSKFYRPIEILVSDQQNFVRNGLLPKY